MNILVVATALDAGGRFDDLMNAADAAARILSAANWAYFFFSRKASRILNPEFNADVSFAALAFLIRPSFFHNCFSMSRIPSASVTISLQGSKLE